MIHIIADNENEKSFDLSVDISGAKGVLTMELISILTIYTKICQMFLKKL